MLDCKRFEGERANSLANLSHGCYTITMQKFEGISFVWALVLMGGIAFVFALRAFIGWQQVRRDARGDFEYKKFNGMINDTISRETYEQIYRRVYGPRGPLHVAVAMLAILIATPLAMMGFEAGLDLIYNLSGQSRVIEPGFLVWQFFLFFGMIAVWVGIAYLVARHYHRTAPGSLQFELDKYLYGATDYGDPF